MALPVAKLGTLALRTLSKPIASRLKSQAAVHPKFRDFIIAIAQMNHRITTTIQRRIYGHATDVEIRPLDEQKAVQAATDLIGEAFIFSVAVAALIFEVQRSARSEARKEEARKQELEELKQREESLAKELEDLKLKLDEIECLAKRTRPFRNPELQRRPRGRRRQGSNTCMIKQFRSVQHTRIPSCGLYS